MNRSRQTVGSRRRLVAVFALGVTCLLALEAVVRLAGLAPPLNTASRAYVADPHLPYKPAPGSQVRGRSSTDEFDFDYRHNSLGYRDTEHALQKPDGAFRIVGIGDSFTYGVGAPFEQTYLVQLEKILNARGGSRARVEVIKLGIPRFFPEPERILLEHYGTRFSPDLILVGFVPNDIMDTAQGIEAIQTDEAGRLRTRESKDLGHLGAFLFERSHVLRIVLSRYVALQSARHQTIKREEIYKADGFHEKDWRKVEEEFGRMVEIAGSHGARIAFLYIPMLETWSAEHGYPAERLSGWAARRNAYFIDTSPALRQAIARGRQVYYPADGHCTPDGYAVIAEVVATALQRAGVVP